MDIVWKSLLGGLMTGFIVWLSRRGNIWPGIVPLFPTFTVIALAAVGLKGDPKGFQETCIAAAKTFPAYAAFLATAYFVIPRANFRFALLIALGVWLLVALVTFLAPRMWQ